ncbi:MAG TPA: universal stress protein [Planctomycetaceae bacterium]|nr:universal stress protein [Planctomycetaceae bacterium]
MLTRFRHILVPLDFTAKNQAALDVARELASQNKASVTFVHAIETIENLEDAELTAFYTRLASRAEAELGARAQEFANAGIRVDRKILYGKRLTEIVREARDQKADLVVVSSHKIDPAAPVQSLGTLSYQISILCECPVLLVK